MKKTPSRRSAKNESVVMSSQSHRLQWNVPSDKFRDFQAAMEKYEFQNNAAFVEAAVNALIRSYKSGDELPRALRFQTVNVNTKEAQP